MKQLASAGIMIAAAAYLTCAPAPADAAPWASRKFPVGNASCDDRCQLGDDPLGKGDDHVFVVLNVPNSLQNLNVGCAPNNLCNLDAARAWIVTDANPHFGVTP
jgi:hypothetical protein